VYLEQDLQQKYDKLLFQGELHWYQRSKEKWIKCGDKNTKYFHAQTIIRRKRNRIHGLHLPNGIWCIDDDLLKDEVQRYFKQLFCSTLQQTNNVTTSKRLHVPKLSEEATSILTQVVTREEVIKALNQMHAYQFPRPDGL